MIGDRVNTHCIHQGSHVFPCDVFMKRAGNDWICSVPNLEYPRLQEFDSGMQRRFFEGQTNCWSVGLCEFVYVSSSSRGRLEKRVS